LNITKMKVAGIPHYLLTSQRDSTSGLPDKVKVVMASYMPAIRSFWNDQDSPFYILSAIPLLNDVPSKMTGMAMPNGLSVRYRGPLDQEKTRLIAHEVSHNWIGVNLKLEQTGMENNWFNEGFNDYIAVYNLVKAGLYSKNDFLSYVNKDNFRSHYTSPVGQVPGDSIENNFFKDHRYEVIPYQRGFIYAFYLDNQIRVASGGRKSLREFLVALDRFNRSNARKPLTISEFTQVLRPFLAGKDVAAAIKKNMHGGEYLNFRNFQLIKGFKIKYDKQVPVLYIANDIDLRKIYR
jgi:predicted metalloprotease with PDZ domain